MHFVRISFEFILDMVMRLRILWTTEEHDIFVHLQIVDSNDDLEEHILNANKTQHGLVKLFHIFWHTIAHRIVYTRKAIG